MSASRLALASSALVAVPVGAFALTWVRIRRYGRSVTNSSADIIVVFAAEVSGGEPSRELTARLDHAIKLFREGRAPTILCSGGPSGPNSEPNVMCRALIEEGVPEDAILIDETGTSTRRTLAAVERLGKGRWNRIVVVSSPYHMYRITTEGRRLGLPVVPSAPPETPITSRLRARLRQTFREVVAIWWYALLPSQRPAVLFPSQVTAEDAPAPEARPRSSLALS